MFNQENCFFDFSHKEEQEEYFSDLLLEASFGNGCSSINDIEPLEIPVIGGDDQELKMTSPLMAKEDNLLEDFRSFYKREISNVSSGKFSTHGTFMQAQSNLEIAEADKNENSECQPTGQNKLNSVDSSISGTEDQKE